MVTQMKEETIHIKNKVDQLSVLAEKLEQLGEKWELPLPLVTNLNLVLEEAVSNIIFYAYDDEKQHQIDILINIDNDVLTIMIIDDGKPFDPTQSKTPDINLPAEEREIGGLGIFLMGKIMDTLKYKREEQKNILTLKKSL